ncbi:hypothetical protein ACH42_06080 [Endozoicomonas sp. (ex Bugula neritina AB1)]|nr:hypothetical protein ACH42_06080 [Endozoicomonas sp. (ex Bugula neritina AB1)]
MMLFWVLLVGLLFKSWLAWLSLGLLYSLSIAPVSNLFLRRRENIPPLPLPLPVEHGKSLIVILGAGMPHYSPEREGYRPSAYTLERLRHGSWMHKQTGLPVLVTGGGNFRPEADTMARSLKEDFGVEATWQENQSLTTAENALFSREMLPGDMRSIILVTHAWHMRRAIMSFESEGFTVTPAPTGFTGDGRLSVLGSWLPKVYHLEKSELAIREWVGLWCYQLAYYFRSKD